jgi:hypothetical protein
MSSLFRRLIQQSRRISRNEFSRTFGDIAHDVVEMLNSENAQRLIQDVRAHMESVEPLSNGVSRLQTLEYGRYSSATELEQGLVASIDGTTTLPIQMYSIGQALCVGIGSLSHRRPLQDSLHYWSSRVVIDEAVDSDDVIRRQEQGIFGISQTAYLRYFEIKHGLEITEPYLLFDGTLIYEWLVSNREGVDLYLDLFNSGKKSIGIIKQLKANALFAAYARAIRKGELFIIETLADHLEGSNVPNKNSGEGAPRLVIPEFANRIAPRILRGVFKPAKKAFGFEVHEEHFDDMIRIMAADCQMNHVGHEIPYLLNRVDEEVKQQFNQRILRDRIASEMSLRSEELFFEETSERLLR